MTMVAAFCATICSAPLKYTALLSTILSLLIGSCHSNGTSFVNQALCAACLLFAELNPFAIVSD